MVISGRQTIAQMRSRHKVLLRSLAGVEKQLLPHTMLECLAARKFMIFRNLPQYEGFLEHQKSAFLVDNEQALVDAFLYVEKSESLDYTPSKEALSLIDKNILTKKYLSICKEIISSNGGAA